MSEIEERLKRIEEHLGIEDRGEPVSWIQVGSSMISFYKMTKKDIQDAYIETELYDINGSPLIVIVTEEGE